MRIDQVLTLSINGTRQPAIRVCSDYPESVIALLRDGNMMRDESRFLDHLATELARADLGVANACLVGQLAARAMSDTDRPLPPDVTGVSDISFFTDTHVHTYSYALTTDVAALTSSTSGGLGTTRCTYRHCRKRTHPT